jgi:hypothetical protein
LLRDRHLIEHAVIVARSSSGGIRESAQNNATNYVVCVYKTVIKKKQNRLWTDIDGR